MHFFQFHISSFQLCFTRSFDIWGGLVQTLDDSGKPMSHTDGTGEISEDVAKLLPVSVFKGKVNNKEGYPTLVQIRMFFRGEAFKGTLQVNQKVIFMFKFSVQARIHGMDFFSGKHQ
jgi:hypothetical protein